MKNKTAIIIQARLGSTRLPKKIIKKLLGKSLIYRIIERIQFCKEIDQIILAMPNKFGEKKIKNDFKKNNIKFFFGPEDNVLKRYYLAAKKFNISNIVRFPGDNAIPDPKEIDRIIKYFKKFKKPLFATNIQNVFNNKYPDGIGAEVFSFQSLNDLMKKKVSKKNKEHIHLNFFDYKKQIIKDKKWCDVRTIKCPKKISFPNLKLDVNYMKDFKFIEKIYNSLYSKKKMFTTLDVIKLLKLHND